MERRPNEAHPLRGARILVVDDEILIAMDVEAMLQDAGADDVVVCTTVAEAMKVAAEQQVQAAVLDVRVGLGTSAGIADTLRRRKIPFLFYSGQPLPEEMGPSAQKPTLVLKPASHRVLLQAVAKLMPVGQA